MSSDDAIVPLAIHGHPGPTYEHLALAFVKHFTGNRYFTAQSCAAWIKGHRHTIKNEPTPPRPVVAWWEPPGDRVKFEPGYCAIVLRAGLIIGSGLSVNRGVSIASFNIPTELWNLEYIGYTEVDWTPSKD
jgi:hypothetical protein